jgi:predicted ATPase/signal transduction histidine kinase
MTVALSGYEIGPAIYTGTRTLVYRGQRQPDSQPVVIKFLRNEYPTFSELLQFRNQYTIAKNLNIPGIIRPLSLESCGNSYALVMEDCGGISLHEYAKTYELELKEILEIAQQLAAILHYLHHNRVIHKDIKPANILIHPETKQVKLIDFSIASLLPKETQEIKNPNVLEGTLAYLAPEQTGRMNRGIDYRSDFYALGVTLFELLTGKLPFESDDPMELVHGHIAQQPPSLVQFNVPEALAGIVAKLIAKNAENRYQSALGLKHDLEICQRQLRETGKIETFEIAKRDLCDRFLIPEKLYGRETEVQILLDAFDRVATGSSELMLVAGFSGIGKTAVINEVHKPIVRQRGYFIKGKFDQFNRNIPLSAFVQALRDLMGQLLSESDAQLMQWQAKILAAAGENGQVLIEVIPELELIIGQQSPVPELSGTAAQNRFNLLFQKFIEVFTTAEHPLVLFLDDLQWADSASLELLKLLMNDNSYLLILGAYRDNEVSPVHPFILMVEELKKTGAIVNTITLEPLAFEDTNQLVADTLNCSTQLAKPLSELVDRKTKGNPFFTTQFLKSLHEDGQIAFNRDRRYWECDIVQVNALALTDDVVEFMALQLQKLPTETQQVLKLAACIGNQFDLNTLVIVSEQSPTEAATALWKALQEGLILPTSQIYKFFQGTETSDTQNTVNPKYRFLHDRVQQAAYSLIPEAERAIAHYQIGQLLLQQISPVAREERIFELVNQLNYGISLISDRAERDNLAQLNLTACQKARVATAYQAALDYAMKGLQLLGAEAWQRQYNLTLTLHELAADVSWLCGEFEQMEEWIEAVIQSTQTPIAQVTIRQIQIQALVSQNKLSEAIAIGRQVLSQLGVSLSDHPTPADIQQDIQEITDLIDNRPIEELFHLPVMVDPQQLAIHKVAYSILPACQIANSPIFPLITTLQIKRSIQFGNSPISGLSYLIYGVLLNTMSPAIELASQFGHLAYRLAFEPGAQQCKAMILVTFALWIHHRKSHLRETLAILQAGYQAGIETGMLDQAGYNGHIFCWYSFWCGEPLAELEPQIKAYQQELLTFNQINTADYCGIYWQNTLRLLDPSRYQAIPSSQAELLAQKLTGQDVSWVSLFYLHQFTTSFLLGNIAEAEQQAAKTKHYVAAFINSICEAIFYFYDSLTVLASITQKGSDLGDSQQQVQDNQAQLQFWADHAPMNYLHKWQLVEAERYRVLGNKADAIDLYDRAITGAKENGYIQEEALANELAAKFYLDWGKEKVAAGYMQEAYYCYAKWGAKAKTADLEERYPQLLQPILQTAAATFNSLEILASIASSHISIHSPTSSDRSSSSSLNNLLDFTSIIKASQALAGTIKIDELLCQMTQIILQNSGGEFCALIIPNNTGEWQVRAIATLENTELCEELLDCNPRMPVKLIQYVKNTKEVVVIDELKTELPVIGDYLHQQQPQSILCLPILNSGSLRGILYLENRLSSGVFAPDRILILNFLCTQAAISLENARLYRQAQDWAQQLEQSQLQIIQSEKMASLGNLVAGVAHEINNPLGFLNGSVSNGKDGLQDLLEHLALYQQYYPDPVAEIQDSAEDIELEYLSEDLPKLLDSMQGAIDRIESISTSLRVFSRADTEYKVRANLHEGIDSTLLILKYRLKANEFRPAIEAITNYGDLPCIECFPGQLNQVFMNIIANAIDALDESNSGRSFAEIQANPNRITIRTTVEKEGVKIAIADNGTGIPSDVKSRIFDHLFTTKAVGKGTGLGLAIARQIVVEKHGGAIDFDSQVGQGTTFAILLPIGVA